VCRTRCNSVDECGTGAECMDGLCTYCQADEDCLQSAATCFHGHCITM
jgi:hypothetical protein